MDPSTASVFAATIQQATAAKAGTCYTITFYGFDNNLGNSNGINDQYVTAKFGNTNFGPYNIPHKGNNFQPITFTAIAQGNDPLFISSYNDQYSTNLDSFSIVPCSSPSVGKRASLGRKLFNRRSEQLKFGESSCPQGENLCPMQPGSNVKDCYEVGTCFEINCDIFTKMGLNRVTISNIAVLNVKIV